MDTNPNQPVKASQFYFACRNGDIETVRHILQETPIEDLDKMECNGSTGLHAACYYRNVDTVKLLLEEGFSRRVINKHNLTPIGECQSEEVRQLFSRPKGSNRFGEHLSKEQWMSLNGSEQSSIMGRLPDMYNGNRLEYKIFHGDQILQQLTGKMPKIGVIRRLFNRAINEKDCKRLIQAYTTDTEFSHRVQDYLDMESKENNSNTPANPMSEYVDTIYFNRSLHEKFQFHGICYRCASIESSRDLERYKVGAKFMTRAFLSATKDRYYAHKYIEDRHQNLKNAVLISIDIRHFNSALDIGQISEFPDEQEILIMNKCVFKIVRIHTPTNYAAEIELRESKSIKVENKDKKGGLLGLFQ